ncbi:hypothetical protein ACRZ5S_22500 (plasmid) [Vibrio scophthalmi]|uniref:hypothetical protein n=1 Tax=Vibrio scophthalmi TaxID=45658 RepID=UPI003EBB8493
MIKTNVRRILLGLFVLVAVGCNYWTNRESKKEGVKSKVALAQINSMKGNLGDSNSKIAEFKQLQIAASDIAAEYAKRSSVDEQLSKKVDEQLLNRISLEKIGITYDELRIRMDSLIQ